MKINKTSRHQVSEESIDIAVNCLAEKLKYRLKEKGYGTFASRHEVLGVVGTEYMELGEAVEHKTMKDVEEELLDVAVGCVFGVACIKEKSLDW